MRVCRLQAHLGFVPEVESALENTAAVFFILIFSLLLLGHKPLVPQAAPLAPFNLHF